VPISPGFALRLPLDLKQTVKQTWERAARTLADADIESSQLADRRAGRSGQSAWIPGIRFRTNLRGESLHLDAPISNDKDVISEFVGMIWRLCSKDAVHVLPFDESLLRGDGHPRFCELAKQFLKDTPDGFRAAQDAVGIAR
jgi:hypothetical protein